MREGVQLPGDHDHGHKGREGDKGLQGQSPQVGKEL